MPSVVCVCLLLLLLQVMLAGSYPQTARKIRRAAIMLNLHREIVRLASHIQEEERRKENSKDGPSLKALAGLSNFFEAIDGAKAVETQEDKQGGGSGDKGGKLEGYSNDIGVQFEIVGQEMKKIWEDITEQRKQSEMMQAELKALRGDSAAILQAVQALGGSRGGGLPPGPCRSSSRLNSAPPTASPDDEDRAQDGHWPQTKSPPPPAKPPRAVKAPPLANDAAEGEKKRRRHRYPRGSPFRHDSKGQVAVASAALYDA